MENKFVIAEKSGQKKGRSTALRPKVSAISGLTPESLPQGGHTPDCGIAERSELEPYFRREELLVVRVEGLHVPVGLGAVDEAHRRGDRKSVV